LVIQVSNIYNSFFGILDLLLPISHFLMLLVAAGSIGKYGTQPVVAMEREAKPLHIR